MTQAGPYAGPIPPIIPAAIQAPPGKAVWPTVIGVIAIVFACLGMLQSLSGVLLPLLIPVFDRMFASMPPGQPNPFAGMRQYMGWLSVMYLVGGAAAGFLLACGIGLVKRRPWSVPAIRAWAVIKLVVAAGTAIVTGLMQARQMEAMFQASSARSPASAPPPGFGAGLGIFSAVFSFAFLATLPVFMLIWFRVKSVREETATWQHGGAAAPADIPK